MQAFKAFAILYLHWAVVWLLVASSSSSHGFAAIVLAIFPPALLFQFGKLDIFWLPFAVAMVVVLFTLMAFYSRTRSVLLRTFVCSCAFLVAFVHSTEIALSHKIADSLPSPRPSCLIERSFVQSLFTVDSSSAQGHTLYVEDGTVYRWSYAKNGFFASDSPPHYVPCTVEYEQYWEKIRRVDA